MCEECNKTFNVLEKYHSPTSTSGTSTNLSIDDTVIFVFSNYTCLF